MQHLAGILNCLVSHKETNMRELYDQGETPGLEGTRE